MKESCFSWKDHKQNDNISTASAFYKNKKVQQIMCYEQLSCEQNYKRGNRTIGHRHFLYKEMFTNLCFHENQSTQIFDASGLKISVWKTNLVDLGDCELRHHAGHNALT